MKPPTFEYVAPATLDEAVAALADDGAMVLAGGQSLVPMLNFRLIAPTRLVDITRIADLDYIKDWNGGLRIGALARHRTLETVSYTHLTLPTILLVLCRSRWSPYH